MTRYVMETPGDFRVATAAYREAAQRHYGTGRIRTGLVHLLGEHNEPDWQSPPAFDFFELGTRLVEARFHDLWPGVAEPACRQAQCGFVSACHGPVVGTSGPHLRPGDQNG